MCRLLGASPMPGREAEAMTIAQRRSFPQWVNFVPFPRLPAIGVFGSYRGLGFFRDPVGHARCLGGQAGWQGVTIEALFGCFAGDLKRLYPDHRGSMGWDREWARADLIYHAVRTGSISPERLGFSALGTLQQTRFLVTASTPNGDQ